MAGMDKQELINKLEESRESMLEAIDGLAEEDLLRAGASGEWSVKEVLSHLTMWEAQIVTLLFQAHAGNKPTTTHFGKESTDALNERWHRQGQARMLNAVMADFEGVRDQTIRRVEALTEDDLTNPKRYSWLDGRALWQWVAEETFEHEAEHGAEIRAWREVNRL